MTTMHLLKLYPSAFAILVGIVGLLVGSFLNVVVYRLPEMMKRSWLQEARDTLHMEPAPTEPFNLAVPNSRCPSCGHSIKPWENIPIFSWILLRGKCSSCRTPISSRYPIVEVVTAGLSFATAWRFGYGAETCFALLMIWGGTALFLIDLDEMVLPDTIVIPGIWLGLAASYLGLFSTLQDGFIGAVTGYLLLALPALTFQMITGRQGMGNGDFKLLALFGAWLGWQSLPLIILVSAVAASIVGIIVGLGVRSRSEPFPFGPFIIAGGLLALFFDHELYTLYGHVTGVNIGALLFD
ncbi:Type 4 prepilin-like proteins leader peptide-processing enzyme [Pseudomonas veronii 1YdBTEX2]|uniref:Prepilin leader peptidase/N-methyltransferase n=2 Tax=Pseudomonas veronii TaxID=76761 RepID=A0A7Y1FBD2_PSEVE|nr:MULTISPECIES: A24 family peptidase [Pseudomonas]NMY12083.1 prepilin peptidase [Pseudomonas veronii]OEC64039.1 methyltransferase [Pseudomonas sp. AP19]SBW84129.1 Type 4 prepilin-like proteins leader peptide-processing enzyme [Pseudomonas veronii 1YdBTEX2]